MTRRHNEESTHREGKVRHIYESHLRIPRALPLVLHRDGHFSACDSSRASLALLFQDLAGCGSREDHREFSSARLVSDDDDLG